MVSRAIFLLCATASCASDASPEQACDSERSTVMRTREPIYYGGAESRYLALAAAEQAAVVALTSEGPELALCTGTLIAPTWILTAEHCTALTSPVAVIDTAGGPIRSPIVSMHVHPGTGVALFEIEARAIDLALVFPIRIATTPVDSSWIGQLVELAGFGATEARASFERRFVVESVANVTPDSIVVDGQGRSGACLGDSGGPLLIRGTDGSVQVAGLLSAGAAHCLGLDQYTRLDTIEDWVLERTGDFTKPAPCGGISREGSCFFGRSVWCDAGTLQSETCVAPAACGWSADENGYRCIGRALDVCEGMDAAGICSGSAAERCDRGTRVSESCTCGRVCARSPQTGNVECVAAESHGLP